MRALNASDSKTCLLTTVWYGALEPAMVNSTMNSGSPVCTKYGLPDTSTAACASVSSIGIHASPNQRLAQRLTKHDRGVLDGVVALDLDVALGLDGQVEAGVGAKRGQHVVEERHAGVDVHDAGAV